jgi:hypothetical protein
MTLEAENIDQIEPPAEPAGIDRKVLETEIIAGARAYSQLLDHAGDDWSRWGAVILGLRGLRNLAFAKAGTTEMASYAYRKEFGALLKLKKYSIYDKLDKPTRSCCYKLMDKLDAINVWHASLPTSDKLKWKHPQSIMKHAPAGLVEGDAEDDGEGVRPSGHSVYEGLDSKVKELGEHVSTIGTTLAGDAPKLVAQQQAQISKLTARIEELERRLDSCPYALLLALVNSDKNGRYEPLRAWLATVVPTTVENTSQEMDRAVARARSSKSKAG